MMKIYMTLVICITLCIPSHSQSIAQTEKKIYRGDNNRLYTNRSQGVYIWISTSPDENSEKILLKSDTSRKYTNPMYFDTEGYNTVRSPSAVDTVTKQTIYPEQDIIFEVYADGTAPATHEYPKATGHRVINGKSYYSGDLKINLKSHDVHSGIKSLQYALNNANFQEYKDDLANFNEGENKLRFYAFDNVGNTEKTKESVFYVDKTPPVTNYEIVGMLNDKFVSPDATIKLTGTDEISGVKAIFYKIGNGSYKMYTKPILVTELGNSQSSLSFYAEDNLGNKEVARSIGGKSGNMQVQGQAENMIFEFYVDNDPPVISLNISEPQFKGKYTYISPATAFTIQANDEKSGVDKVYYSLNTAEIGSEYSQPVHVTNEGIFVLRIKSVDFVGNISAVLTNTFLCDVKAPSSKISITGPKFESRDTVFVSSGSVFNLSANDDHSGISKITYSADGTSKITFDKGFNLKKSGYQVIEFQSADHVSNVEENQKFAVFVDNVAPRIHYHFSVESIGTKSVRDEEYTIYPTNAMLYVASTDASSGSDKITYSINGGVVLTANPIKGLASGNYEIEVKAFDVLGNMSSEKIKFAIEK